VMLMLIDVADGDVADGDVGWWWWWVMSMHRRQKGAREEGVSE
jgi:hypothetical protein